MAENSLPPETMVGAVKSLLDYLDKKPGDGSAWVRFNESNWLRVDIFEGSVKATVFAINALGVVDLSSAVVITDVEEPKPLKKLIGEIDINKTVQRYQELVDMGEVGVRREAWRFMASGDTLIGMDFDAVVQFVLGWEIQLYPENFWKEVNGVRDATILVGDGGGDLQTQE